MAAAMAAIFFEYHNIRGSEQVRRTSFMGIT